MLEISSFYKCLPKTTIFWAIIHMEMASFILVQQKTQSYDICLLRYGVRHT